MEIVIKFGINVILLLIYLYFFGQKSIQRYLDNAVFITEKEEYPVNITPPGKTKVWEVRSRREINHLTFLSHHNLSSASAEW